MHHQGKRSVPGARIPKVVDNFAAGYTSGLITAVGLPNAEALGLLSGCPLGTGLRACIGLDTIHVASGSALAETITAR